MVRRPRLAVELPVFPEAFLGLDHRIGHLASISTQKIERLNSSRG
jgi:hypothetical protein